MAVVSNNAKEVYAVRSVLSLLGTCNSCDEVRGSRVCVSRKSGLVVVSQRGMVPVPPVAARRLDLGQCNRLHA